MVVLFWTKCAVPREIKPGILKLTTRRGQRNFRTVFIFVSCEENGCYRIVSLGHQNFDCRSYCGLSRRMQGRGSNAFRPHYAGKIKKRILDLCLVRRLCRENHMIIVTSSFLESFVLKMFSVHTYHRFRWYATLENKTLPETFPKFPSILRVIDMSDRNPPITATSVTFSPSLRHASGLWLVDFDPTCREHVILTEILETFPGVFCFPKSHINENGGKHKTDVFVSLRFKVVGTLKWTKKFVSI